MRALLNEIDTARLKASCENDLATWTKLNDAKHALIIAIENFINA